MRVALIAASVIALAALPGGFTASAHANTPETVQQRTAVAALSADELITGARDNNGNG